MEILKIHSALLLVIAVCQALNHPLDHHQVRSTRSVSLLLPSIFGDTKNELIPPNPATYAHPPYAGLQRHSHQNALPETNVRHKTRIPDDIAALAYHLGVRDFNSLPSIEELTSFLQLKSPEETIELIRSLAQTADGLEMMREYITNISKNLEENTVTTSTTTTTTTTIPPPPLLPVRKYRPFSRYATTLDSAATDLNLLGKVLARPPSEGGFLTRLASWLGYSSAVKEDQNITAEINAVQPRVIWRVPASLTPVKAIRVNPAQVRYIPTGYSSFVPRIGRKPTLNGGLVLPNRRTQNFRPHLVDRTLNDPLEVGASEPVSMIVPAPVMKGQTHRASSTPMNTANLAVQRSDHVNNFRPTVNRFDNASNSLMKTTENRIRPSGSSHVMTSNNQAITQVVHREQLNESSSKKPEQEHRNSGSSKVNVVYEVTNNLDEPSKPSVADTNILKVRDEPGKFDAFVSPIKVSEHQEPVTVVHSESQFSSAKPYTGPFSVPQRVAGVNEEAYASGRIYKADLSSINIPIVMSETGKDAIDSAK